MRLRATHSRRSPTCNPNATLTHVLPPKRRLCAIIDFNNVLALSKVCVTGGKVTSRTGDETTKRANSSVVVRLQHPLRCLSADQIQAIDNALSEIGSFGEVRLIKNGGKVRFIQTMKSKALTRER